MWVKMTVNRRLAKSHGYYLQHAKEVCLVARKGSDPRGMKPCAGSDIIYSERRGQSQKPEEIYQLIEQLVPGGTASQKFLKISYILRYLAHRHNKRVGKKQSVGNHEKRDTSNPKSSLTQDISAYRAHINQIPLALTRCRA